MPRDSCSVIFFNISFMKKDSEKSENERAVLKTKIKNEKKKKNEYKTVYNNTQELFLNLDFNVIFLLNTMLLLKHLYQRKQQHGS